MIRRASLIAAGFVCICQIAAAGVCVSGSLADYIALGSAGCTIGANTVSKFLTLGGIPGADVLTPGDISLTPTGSAVNPGLQATVVGSAGANALVEAIFSYQISGASYTAAFGELSGASETGDGAVTGSKNLCSDGSFGPDGVSGCTGIPASLATLDGFQNADTTGVQAMRFLTVTDDLTLDGGTAGSASGGTFTNRFTAVPEPGTLCLLAAGLVAVIGVARRSGAKEKEERSRYEQI